MITSNTRIVASTTAAILSLGIGGWAAASWGGLQSGHPASASGHHVLSVQDRGRPGSTFRGAPEFPPSGYLEEVDPTAQDAFDRQPQALSREAPPAPGSRAWRFAPENPEFAPEGLGSRVPLGAMQRPPEPWGTGSGSPQPMWGTPSPPVIQPSPPAPEWSMPPTDAADAWGEFPARPPTGGARDWQDRPGMRAEPRDPSWGEFPGDPTHRPAPDAIPEYQWPRSEASDDRFPRYTDFPDYAPEPWDRAYPESSMDRFPEYRDYRESPRGGYDWGR